MKKYWIIIAMAAMVCSCEIPFSIEDISEPRFLVECLPAADADTLDIFVAYADAAYSKNRAGKYAFSSDNVVITVNDKPLDTSKLKWEQNGNCFQSYICGGFASGDRVTVTAKGKSMPVATGSTVVPEVPKLAEVKVASTEDKKDTAALRVSVKMEDPVRDGDYYGLEIKSYEETYFIEITQEPPFFRRDTMKYTLYTTPGQVASMSDINNMDLDGFAQVRYIYGGLINRSRGYTYDYRPMVLLSSRQFDGDTYSFYLNASFSFLNDMLDGMTGDTGYEEPDVIYDPEYPEEELEYPETEPDEDPEYPDDEDPDDPDEPEAYRIVIGFKKWYEVEIFRLSEELYNYCKAQYLKDFNILSNFGVTPPNFTYSNVDGGLGVVGGVSRAASGLIPDPNNKEPEMPDLMSLIGMLK